MHIKFAILYRKIVVFNVSQLFLLPAQRAITPGAQLRVQVVVQFKAFAPGVHAHATRTSYFE